MQNKYDWSGYTTRIRKKSFTITFLIHLIGISSLLFLSGKKNSLSDEIFIVQMVEIPPLKISRSVLKMEKKIPEIKKRELIREKSTIREKKVETPSFSIEEYKKRLERKINLSMKESKVSKIKNVPIKIPEIKSTSLNIKNLEFSLTIPQWYILMVKSEIRKNWILKENFTGLSAIVSFRVTRDGRIKNITLEKSSGFSFFDNSVIEAVKLTKQLPSFPEEIKEKYLEIVIEFKTEG